jgi:hypothetical protein
MASLFNVIFSISQRISQYQLTMQFLGAFSLLSFLAGLAVAAYNDACPSCTEIYDGGCDKDSGTVKILIGNAGAGQSGLAKGILTLIGAPLIINVTLTSAHSAC